MDTAIYNRAYWLRKALPAGMFLENPHRTGGLDFGPAIAERTPRNQTELVIRALPQAVLLPVAFQKSALQ